VLIRSEVAQLLLTDGAKAETDDAAHKTDKLQKRRILLYIFNSKDEKRLGPGLIAIRFCVAYSHVMGNKSV